MFNKNIKSDISDLLKQQKEEIISEIQTLAARPEDPWMDTSDVMAYMKWSRGTLSKYRWEIPFRKLGKLMIRRSEFDRWLEEKFN